MPTNPEGERNLRRRSTPLSRITALVSLAATLIFASSRLTGATTINANSASQSDVAAAIASAADGDIVTIPAGTATWTRPLRVRKGITIQGAGIGSTVIKDNVQNGALIGIDLVAGKLTRLTGIEFQDGGRVNGQTAPAGILHVDGSNTNGSTFRFDHCKWNNLNGPTVFDTVIGVIDHNTFVIDKFSPPIYAYGTHWNGQDNGDGSWAAPTGYGTDRFLFIEDNVFTQNNQGGGTKAVTDAYAGARFVVRRNQLHDGLVTNHGTESTGRARGCRAIECYNNSFAGANSNKFVGGSRSGGVLFHDNTVAGFWGGLATFTLENYRTESSHTPWNGADGVNPWDVNAPNAFFTGTAASANTGTTITVSGSPGWTANQWVGYTLRRVSDRRGSGTINLGEIRSNTFDSITYTANGYGPSMSFVTGDSLEIRKVNQVLDGSGRARGSLVSGGNPTPPHSWNDQVTEPCYSWNNTNIDTGGRVNFSQGSSATVRLNEHYFNDTPMPGYTPYTYPHPLTKSLPPPEQMTRNAPGNSQHNLDKKRQPWGGKKLDRKKAKKAKESPTNEMPDGQDNPGN